MHVLSSLTWRQRALLASSRTAATEEETEEEEEATAVEEEDNSRRSSSSSSAAGSRAVQPHTNVMSTASKAVLALSVVLTVGTVAGVHLKQTWDRQVHRGSG